MKIEEDDILRIKSSSFTVDYIFFYFIYFFIKLASNLDNIKFKNLSVGF